MFYKFHVYLTGLSRVHVHDFHTGVFLHRVHPRVNLHPLMSRSYVNNMCLYAAKNDNKISPFVCLPVLPYFDKYDDHHDDLDQLGALNAVQQYFNYIRMTNLEGLFLKFCVMEQHSVSVRSVSCMHCSNSRPNWKCYNHSASLNGTCKNDYMQDVN